MGSIFVDNDTDVILQNYTLVRSGALVTDATGCVFSIYLDDGTGRLPTGPKTLTLMPGLSAIAMTFYGTTSMYAGTIPGTVLLTPLAWYFVKVTPSPYNDVFQDWFQAGVRTSRSG